MSASQLTEAEWDLVFELAERCQGVSDAQRLAALREQPGRIRDTVLLQLELGEPPRDPDRNRSGERIGARIEVRKHLRDGGAGSVYLGICTRDGGTLPVAVKLLRVPREAAAAAALREAWLREQQLLRELSASGRVAPLVEAGEHASRDGARFLYLCTEYKYGLDIRSWCDQHELDAAGRVRLFLKVCDAVSAIHAHGLVHGDLKPANLQVELQEGVPAIWILDLGLTVVQGGAWQGSGELVGTPGYMSPEQISEFWGEICEATDVHALGAILFELLEGRPWLDARGAATPDALAERMRALPRPQLMQVLPAARRDRLGEVLEHATAWDPGARYPQVSALRQALHRALHGEAGEDAELRPLPSSAPYRGLLPFEEADADWFFGREEQVALLLEMLREQGWVALIGASGSGKSSLVRAGLLPAVRAGALDRAHAWTPILMRPGPRPLHELALQLRNLLGPGRELPDLEQQLLAEPDFLANELAGEAIRQTPERRFLWVVDAFEELFAQCSDPQQQRAFIAALLGAARSAHGRVRVIAVLRADFTDRALEHPELAEVLKARASHLLVGPLGKEGLRAAIERPAERAGVALEPGLQELLVQAVWGEPGSLPLLQFVLDALWEQRDGRYLTLAAYEKLGGLKEAIARRADTELARLEQRGQGREVRLLLHRLVQPGDGAPDTRRRLPIGELVAIHPEIAGPLEALIGARLLTAQRAEGDERHADGVVVEIAHEALIREWGTLRRWIDEDRELLQLQQKLERATRLWAESREASDLWRGSRLTQAVELLEEGRLILARDEQAFLAAARAEVERAQREAEAQRRHELEAAQQLAAAQARSVRRLAAGLAASGVLLVALSALAAIAVRARAQAQATIEDAIRVAQEVVSSIDRRLENLAGASHARREILEVGAGLLDRLDQGMPADTRSALLRNRMAYHRQRGDLALRIEDAGRARAEYEAALGIAERLAQQHAGDAQAQDERAVCREKLGEVAEAQGRLADARRAYEASLAIEKPLAGRDPGDAAVRSHLTRFHNRLGGIAEAEGKLAEARAAYQQALASAKRGAELDPGDAGAQRDLAVTYSKLGALAQAEGKLDDAADAYQQFLEISQRLAERDPGNAGAQRDLAISYSKLGAVAQAQGALAAAGQAYAQFLAIAQRMAMQDPSNSEVQRQLSVSYAKLGEVAAAQGKLADARSGYQQFLAIAQRLAELDPSNAQAQRDLSVGHTKLGELAEAEGRPEQARDAYDRSLAIVQRLVEQEPNDAEVQRDRFFLVYRSGVSWRSEGKFAEALLYFQEAKKLAEQNLERTPTSSRARQDLEAVRDALAQILRKGSGVSS